VEKELTAKKGTKMQNDCVTNPCCAERRDACEKVINIKFETLKDTFETKVESVDRATELAASALKERLAALNEVRQMAQDRDLNFVTKGEFNAQVLNIEQLRLSEAKLAGKADQVSVDKVDKRVESANNRGNIGIIIAIVTFIVSIAIHFIK
jgi:hypothetical protein